MGINKFFNTCLLLVAFLVLPQLLSAQEPEQRRIDGQDYLVHTVAPGNTLFAISKAYSADIQAIKAANPGADVNLGIGQELLIPMSAINKREARRSDVRTDGEFLLHTVQRKETLFSISRLYGLTVKDITALNPDAVGSLSTGMVLTIPVQLSTTAKEKYLEPARNDSFYVHQVMPGETVYSISKQYGISTDSLFSANPQYRDGLPVDAWLTIPKYKEEFLEITTPATPGEIRHTTWERGKPYNIVLMLPFELQQNDSLAKSLMPGSPLGMLTEIALDFYRGARIALDSLAARGFNADVSVVDLGDDLVAAREALRTPALQEAHLIIGPMHRGSLGVVSEHAKKNHIYLVSPNNFSNQIFSENPYFFRATASRETMLKYLANFVAIQHTKHNVLMVSSESPKDWPERKLFKQHYNAALANFPNHQRDSLLSITKRNISSEQVERFLRKDTLNVLVVPSNDPAFVSDFVMRLLPFQRQGYRIQLYGLDQWVRFDNIDAEYKNRFNLRLVVPNHLDYSNDHLITFLEKYREAYNTEPGGRGYGFQGYDLTMFFGMALLNNGPSFIDKTDVISAEGAMGSYRFGKTSNGVDFENKSVLMVEYDNYRIKRIN